MAFVSQMNLALVMLYALHIIWAAKHSNEQNAKQKSHKNIPPRNPAHFLSSGIIPKNPKGEALKPRVQKKGRSKPTGQPTRLQQRQSLGTFNPSQFLGTGILPRNPNPTVATPRPQIIPQAVTLRGVLLPQIQPGQGQLGPCYSYTMLKDDTRLYYSGPASINVSSPLDIMGSVWPGGTRLGYLDRLGNSYMQLHTDVIKTEGHKTLV